MFTSWGVNTAKKYSSDEIKAILDGFTETNDFGAILRAKGIVEGTDGEWIYFDYVPGEADVRTGAADVTGKLCVIGSSLNEEKLAQAFGV
ncbi:MAG: GTP-binding protein [Lachnospiraceae bacterium]